MLQQGFISEQDLSLYKIVEDVELAVQEIKNFYRNYHSYRYVNKNLVVRMVHPPTDELIQRLNSDFKDMLTAGKIKRTDSLPEESDDPDTLQLPRLLVPFSRVDYGRLRQMIDVINAQS